MFRDDLEELMDKSPFEPFRIKLVSGDIHDVYNPQNAVVMTDVVSLTPPDQNWTIFPIDKIASIESLFADFQGKLAEHSTE